jgi:dihydrofolate synthase / folylpolyglutamate synthase
VGENTYQKQVDKIFNLQFFGIKLGLVNIQALLADLGNPQDKFPVVLVAGTNGKGSVASTLASIAKESGLTCGLFTSPHLVRFNERFAVNGVQISDEKLLAIADLIWERVDNRQETENPDGPSPITFFEFATAMACVHFSENKCDLGIFEVGLGGRLDATNALEPILDVFTPISYDHTQYLGDTLTSIAGEKAGVLRNGVPAVVGKQEAESLETLESHIAELNVPAWIVDRDFGIRWGELGATYWDPDGELSPVTTSLPGAYQLGNTAIALAAARLLKRAGIAITNDAIAEGPKKVHWPGRLEKVAENPIVLLDGAHNVAAAKLLCESLDENPVSGKTVAVMSIMEDKDVEGIVSAFAPAFDVVVATAAKMPRATSPADLAHIVKRNGPEVQTAVGFIEALEIARHLAGPSGRVVICGSLFLVGEARAFLMEQSGQGEGGEWVGVRG